MGDRGGVRWERSRLCVGGGEGDREGQDDRKVEKGQRIGGRAFFKVGKGGWWGGEGAQALG